MLKPIYIACSFNMAYSQHAAVMLTSLFENNKESQFTVFLLSSYLDDDTIDIFETLAAKYQNSCINLKIVKELFAECPIGTLSKQITVETYYRLILPNVLPEYVHKILYFDCDIVVNGEILELWQTDIEGVALAAVEDSLHTSKTSPKRLGYDSKYSYFNAGVLLLNIDYLRNINFTEIAFDYINKNSDLLLFHDQDVMNALLYDRKIYLSVKWNMLDVFLFRRSPVKKEMYTEILRYRDTPIIIHFSGMIKPWHNECRNPYIELYKKYLLMTPWCHYTIRSRFNKQIDLMIYELKYRLKFILDYLRLSHCVFYK